VSTSTTFDWPDAGVGFATALGAVLLLGAAAIGISRDTGRELPV